MLLKLDLNFEYKNCIGSVNYIADIVFIYIYSSKLNHNYFWLYLEYNRVSFIHCIYFGYLKKELRKSLLL